MATKDEVRLLMMRLRREHSPAERRDKSLAITARLQNHPEYESAHTILFYNAKEDEVDTRQLILHALMHNKTVCLPRVDEKKKDFEARAIDSLYNLETGPYGILQPQSADTKIKFESIDLAVVPGVAFDLWGNRIGHGKGYYDRAFPKMSKAKKIALAFDFQILDTSIVAAAHDVKVTEILTERRDIVTMRAAGEQEAEQETPDEDSEPEAKEQEAHDGADDDLERLKFIHHPKDQVPELKDKEDAKK